MPSPILTVAQMRDWEQATWKTGCTEAEVIAKVGGILAHRILELTSPGDSILLLAGKGHNGDDARHCAEHLEDRQATLLEVTDPVEARSRLPLFLSSRPALIVDGLFGIGLSRSLNQGWEALITAINASQTPVLAVDVPSGLNADTGQPRNVAIRASITLTVGAAKRGLLAQEAWPCVGRLEVAPEIGLIPCPHQSDWQWTLPADFEGYPPPRRDVGAHKGSFGHALLMCGSLGYHGAAVLASRGALRAQPGLVTVVTQDSTYVPVAAQCQAAMVHPWRHGDELPSTTTAFMSGPGLAAADLPEGFKEMIRALWRDSELAVIIDASALAWLPPGGTPPGAIRVITPHPGEAARLLNSTSAEVQSDRPTAVRKLSEKFGNAWVVLKGHQTWIGRSTGDLHVNSSGNAWLAQGGSGDVLAGYMAGLLAQPPLQNDALLAIRYAVWQHGASADKLARAETAWTVEDLAGELGAVRGGCRTA